MYTYYQEPDCQQVICHYFFRFPAIRNAEKQAIKIPAQ